jgi:hypothetical protein
VLTTGSIHQSSSLGRDTPHTAPDLVNGYRCPIHTMVARATPQPLRASIAAEEGLGLARI